MAAALALMLLGSACTTAPRYEDLKAGTFKGQLIVLWVGEGGPDGDGAFVFVPDPQSPLTFTRLGRRGPGAEIRPGLMYTDGGSIPRLAQVFRGFSPWGYAPSYMVHDWLFIARHCLRDGLASAEQRKMADVTFEESAAILGEAIKTLVETRRVQPNDIAAGAITGAVGSGIARELWDKPGACTSSWLKPEHLAAAEQAVPGSTRFATGLRTTGAAVVQNVPPARIVGRVGF